MRSNVSPGLVRFMARPVGRVARKDSRPERVNRSQVYRAGWMLAGRSQTGVTKDEPCFQGKLSSPAWCGRI